MKSKIQGWKIAKQRSKKGNRIPPFVPSKNEIEFYTKYIKEVAKLASLPNKAIILGATPELRDGAIKFGLESVAVDVSREMMEKFSKLMKHKKSKLDRRVLKNWLLMKFPKGSFGIIVGDASLNNLVTRKDNEKLVKVCSEILAKGGYLVLRQILYVNKPSKKRDIHEIVSNYRKGKMSWEDFYIELRILFYKDKVYNKKTFQYDARKNFKYIDALREKGILTEKEYLRINEFRNEIINTFYPEDEFIKMIERKGFKLVEKFHDKPHEFFKCFFTLVFKKV